jgi:hypothetical protein
LLARDFLNLLDSLARRPMAGRLRGSESCESACGYERGSNDGADCGRFFFGGDGGGEGAEKLMTSVG